MFIKTNTVTVLVEIRELIKIILIDLDYMPVVIHNVGDMTFLSVFSGNGCFTTE